MFGRMPFLVGAPLPWWSQGTGLDQGVRVDSSMTGGSLSGPYWGSWGQLQAALTICLVTAVTQLEGKEELVSSAVARKERRSLGETLQSQEDGRREAGGRLPSNSAGASLHLPFRLLAPLVSSYFSLISFRAALQISPG